MSYNKYCVTLYPGSRPGGAPRFGSAAEQSHYETVIATFKDYKDFKDLPMLGSFSTSLTDEEAEALRLDPIIRAVDLYRPSKPCKITQADAGWGLAVLANRQAEDKYSYSYTGKDIDIYIIDSGVNCDLDEFEGRATRVYDNDPTENPPCDHGTETAATAASKTYGTAKKANILDIKVHATDCYIWGVEGLNAVLAHHTTRKAICNMSFGGPDVIAGEEDAINALIAEGVICIAAAGNDSNQDDHYPSDHCISIAASTDENKAAYFTNYGDKVDLFAPGYVVRSIDRYGTPGDVNGTSFSCPYTCGIAAMVLESRPIAPTHLEMLAILIDWCIDDGITHNFSATTTRLVQSQIPVVYLGALGGASTDSIDSLDFRNSYSIELSYLENDDSIIAITDSTFNTTRYADAAITLSVSGPFNKVLGSIAYEALKIGASDNPIMGTGPITPITPGASVRLYATATAAELMTLTMSLNPAGGTATFATVEDTLHETKELINLQGLDCIIERIGPSYGPGKSFGADCVVSPELSSEYISLHHAYANDGNFVSVKDMIEEAAGLAGVAVAVLLADVKVTEFIRSGKFSEVLSSLAELLFGEVLLQNGTWYIGRPTTVLGDFTINNYELKSFTSIKQGDVANTVMGLISSLLQALIDKHDLEEEIKDLKKELEDLEAIEDLEEEAGKVEGIGRNDLQFLGNVQIEFGNRAGPWQMIDNTFKIDARDWTYFTPEEGNSVDPDYPTKQYYQVEELMGEDGKPTGEMRGLERLGIATIRASIQEPSNFGGLYHCKGKAVNFFGGFSEVGWTSPRAVTESKINTETGLIEKETFLEFSPWTSRFDPFAKDDKQHYLLDLEIRYTPSMVIPWKFSGTLDFQAWPVYVGGTCIGSITRDGTFSDPTGARITTVDDVDEIPGGGVINENYVCIFNVDRELCGVVLLPGYCRGITGTHAGVIEESTGVIRSTSAIWGSIFGYLAGGDLPVSFHFPGIGDVSEMEESRNIYFTSEMPGGHGIDFAGYDPDHPETWNPELDPAYEVRDTEISELKITIAEKENELLTLIIEIAFLEEELTSYGAQSLIPLIHTAADAKIALNTEIERQQEIGIKNVELIKRRHATIADAMTAVYSTLSSLHLESLKVTASFIYNNILPLPQNLLSIQGNIADDNLILTSVSLALGSKSVSIEAIRRIA